MPKNVFIDTNIYLAFIQSSNEGLRSFNILKEKVASGEVKLIFPQITQEEFYRNLPIIKAAYKDKLEGAKAKIPNFPSIIQGKTELDRLEKAAKSYNSKLDSLWGTYSKHTDKLKSDVEHLIKSSEAPITSTSILERAKTRRAVGNPPGKGGHQPLGDEIVWEVVLDAYYSDPLIIVSGDGDWSEVGVDSPELKSFLEREWKARSSNNIVLYDSLGRFVNSEFKEQISEIEIEQEKIATHVADSITSPSYSVSPSYAAATSVYTSDLDPYDIPTASYSPSYMPTAPVLMNCVRCNNAFYSYMGEKICQECARWMRRVAAKSPIIK